MYVIYRAIIGVSSYDPYREMDQFVTQTQKLWIPARVGK